ncbi:MAG: CarD family transcriptional regulator [bacterium]|nr:CarD family transcriptional regulator [bacterium]
MPIAHPSKTIERVLIVGITPYFLEKGNVWFEENFAKIVEARQTQVFFQENTLLLEKNQEHSLSELLRKLDELGYEKVFEVRDPGEFVHLGGHVEVFPINSSNAIRIEFLGNKIESIERLEKNADEEVVKNILKKRLKSQKLFSDIKNLKEGEYLVHLDHGVAQYTGMQELMPEHLYYTLEYLGQDKLFVPVGLERKLSRYVGFGEPHISRLGSPFWSKTKRKIKEEVEKLAQQLLDLYAQREVTSRLPYQEPSLLSEHVASSFQYEETPDQIQALQEINKDLERTEPMDRLLCGDVGFGKTEVALRTMVRAVEQGYQAALLAPTTILAYQHFQNFSARLKNLPLQVVFLSRLQTQKEQHIALEKIHTGKADLIVSTHRLFSSDVQFKNLGLLVIDDEQRFGVKQKEKLRELKTSLDVLSLSATPIPRTLYMSLASLKNISIIQTPPEGRFPVRIVVQKRNEKIIREAIEKELARKGQIYYLHNRIGTIALVKKHLERLVPSARIGIVHGRLRERELIRVMDDFKDRTYDVLVATTIIENGLDLPNVNTLVVEDATKLGLSQAYQIRGRVGRSHTESFAYFLHGAKLEGKVKLRLDALSEAGALGSGYRIALRDMEIRGAGNILGKEQSGNVNAVGLNLYCQMLSEAVEKLKS